MPKYHGMQISAEPGVLDIKQTPAAAFPAAVQFVSAKTKPSSGVPETGRRGQKANVGSLLQEHARNCDQ